MTARSDRPGGRAAYLWFRLSYIVIRFFDPLVRAGFRVGWPGASRAYDLLVPGRRSGLMRRTLVTLISVDGRSYIGHPSGDVVWTRNVEAAELVWLSPHDAPGEAKAYRPIRLLPGQERTDVIIATFRQQMFPANLLYRLAARHVFATGVYFRLEPPPGG
jgi:hypothetical protein